MKRLGGLIGIFINGSLRDCYAHGEVSGTDKAGGLIGYAFGGDVNDCYSTGRVVATTNRGGLVGDSETTVDFYNCFWDTESSGVSYSDGGTGKTTIEMIDITTYESAGWDLETTWSVEPTVRIYPWLHMYLPGDLDRDGIVNFYDIAILTNQWLMER